MDPTALISLLPEPWRTYALAALQALAAVVLVSSVITAHTPAWAFKRWRVLRVFSFLSAFAPRDGAGTLKLPLTTPSQPGAVEELARIKAQWEAIARVAGSVVPPPAPPAGGAS